MKKISLIVLLLVTVSAGIGVTLFHKHTDHPTNPTESLKTELQDSLITKVLGDDKPTCNLPQSPKRIGLQVGHWKNEEAPDELKSLREKGDGAAHGSVAEWEAMLTIAEKVKPLLEAQGYVVDILPTTIPESYCADAFVSLHADSSTDTTVTGYKGSAPYRDSSGKSNLLNTVVESAYATETGLPYEPTVTRNMRGYYAFNWIKYQHAVHPNTPAIIFETAFLSNPSDRAFLTDQSDIAATGLAKGIINFLNTSA